MTPTLPPAPAPAPKSNTNKTVLIIVLVVVGLFLFCIICSGVLAAIAIPNYIKFNSRAKQSECKATLKSLYLAQASYFAEKDDYGDTAEAVGFVTSGRTRYTYFGGPELIVAPTDPQASQVTEGQLPILAGEALPGVEGECPECHFTAACAANIDSDGTLDVWSVSTQPRTHNGQPVAAGELVHDVDDLEE